jgi:hypothetical protein
LVAGRIRKKQRRIWLGWIVARTATLYSPDWREFYAPTCSIDEFAPITLLAVADDGREYEDEERSRRV